MPSNPMLGRDYGDPQTLSHRHSGPQSSPNVCYPLAPLLVGIRQHSVIKRDGRGGFVQLGGLGRHRCPNKQNLQTKYRRLPSLTRTVWECSVSGMQYDA